MPNKTAKVYIGLGSNLEQPALQLQSALSALHALPNTRFIACSRFYQTAAVGLQDQPDFLNAVACLETSLSPHEVLSFLQQIENAQGRVRAEKNGPRTLDLDLLLYGNQIMADPQLTLPHPLLHMRAFVLVPLLEIAPTLILPNGKPAQDYLNNTLLSEQAVRLR